MFTFEYNFSSLLSVVNEEPTKGSAKVECLNPTTKYKMNKIQNDATIPLRTSSALKDALQILAQKADRSLSNYIKGVLDAHIQSLAPAPAPAHVVTFKSKAKAKPKAKAKAKPKAKVKK